MYGLNPATNDSAGTAINRYLDALGYPDSFGDAIGALIDVRMGGHHHGPHLRHGWNGYPVHETVGRRARIGQTFSYGFGPIQLRGRITGRNYVGSFGKPIKLANGKFLFHGRIYADRMAIIRDSRDGRIDGKTPSTEANGSRWEVGGAGWRDLDSNRGESLFGSPQSTGGTGESILANPNLPLEDKLAMLLAQLSEHFDKKIENKMGEVERAQKRQESWAGFEKIGHPFGPDMSAGPADLIGLGGRGEAPNLQLLQTQLQQLLQKRQQMFQTMSTMLKSLHETSMSTIRNLKA